MFVRRWDNRLLVSFPQKKNSKYFAGMSESRKWALIKYKYCTKTNIFFVKFLGQFNITGARVSSAGYMISRSACRIVSCVLCSALDKSMTHWIFSTITKSSKVENTNSHPTRPQHRYQSTINSLSQLHVLHVFYNWNSASDLFNPWSLIRTLVWYKWTTLLRARDWENWLLARI